MGVGQVFDSVLSEASGYLTTLKFSIIPLSDLILPPMSSKLLKYIVLSLECLRDVHDVIMSKASFKPITLYTLRRGGVRLYSTLNSRSPLVIRGNEVLEGRIVVFTGKPFSLSAISGCEGLIEYSGSKLSVSLVEAVVENVRDITADVKAGEPFKIVIHTPLLLSPKLMTPPPIAESKLITSIKPGYRLLPTPSYIMSAACKEWLGIVKEGKVKEHVAPYIVGRLSDITFYEVDVSIKPVTVVYGKTESNKLKLVRGPIGYIVLKLTTKKLERITNKLLAFATRMGIGKSRSIGFGEMEIKKFKT